MTFVSYDGSVSRVQIDLATVRGLVGSDTTALVERSLDLITWSTVRGGADINLTTTATPLDDYEFTTDVENSYRVTPQAGSAQIDSLTPSIGEDIWLKHIRYPFLNMAVKLSDASDISRAGGSGVFQVIGRALPVVVTSTRQSATYSVTVNTRTKAEREALTALLSTGDVVLLQVPADYVALDGAYLMPGDTTETRQGIPDPNRWIEVQVTECAAPAEDVIGSTCLWQTVVNNYATWEDLIDDQATWYLVLTIVGSPADVIVP